MTNVAWAILGMVGATLAAGCAGSDAAAAGSEEGAGGERLCPGCIATVGGETSDFGGGEENCLESELPLSDEDASVLGLEQMLSSAAAPMRMPLRWFAAGSQEGQTTVAATFELGEAAYFAIGTEISNACRDSIRIPAHIELETADGGLSATLEGTLKRRRGELQWTLHASTDLSLVSGTRELGIDTMREHLGRLVLIINGFFGERRGLLEPQVLYVEGGWSAAFEDAMHLYGQPTAPWVGSFPGDACGSSLFPVDLTAPHPFLGNQTVQDVFDRARAALPVSEPARLRDGAPAQALVDISADISAACMSDYFGSAALMIDGAAHLKGGDGLFDVPVDKIELRLDGTSGAPASLILSRNFESRPRDEVVQGMGIQGRDFLDHERLFGEARVDYVWTAEGLTSLGRVGVRDGVTLQEIECLVWPPGGGSTGCHVDGF